MVVEMRSMLMVVMMFVRGFFVMLKMIVGRSVSSVMVLVCCGVSFILVYL